MPADRLKRILGLALPIIAGMTSQNVFNLVDTAMVGTLGNAALAAVGLGGFATFTASALLFGVSTGVQAMAARRIGAGEASRAAYPLNTGLLLVILAGTALTAVLYFQVPRWYPYLNSDPAVIRLGAPYLQIRLLAMVFVAMNFAFRGYWNAVDLSRLYMSTLIVMHGANIALNYTLIFGHFGAPALGVEGAAIASSIATVLGTIVYIALGFRHARRNGFLRGLGTVAEVRTLIGISVPNGVQQLSFSAGFTALYWIIGRVGTVELAAASVLINVIRVALLPGLGLGMAAATLVGQALGRGEPRDAALWGWNVLGVAVVLMSVLGLPMWAAPDWVMSLFVHDSATVEVARWPMRLQGLFMPVEALGMVLMNALLGAGDAKRVMVVSVGMQWLLLLPLVYWLGPVLGLGLLVIWFAQSGHRGLQGLIFLFLWRRGKWTAIRM